MTVLEQVQNVFVGLPKIIPISRSVCECVCDTWDFGELDHKFPDVIV